MNLSPMVAPLAVKKNLVKVGSTVVYSDMCNYNEYEVIAVDEYSFTIKDYRDVDDVRDFDSLQHGWDLLKDTI